MRKKMLLLTLALAAFAGALTSSATAADTTYCPQCTYYADGSRCCVSCWCRGGFAIMCTDNYCPPPEPIE